MFALHETAWPLKEVFLRLVPASCDGALTLASTRPNQYWQESREWAVIGLGPRQRGFNATRRLVYPAHLKRIREALAAMEDPRTLWMTSNRRVEESEFKTPGTPGTPASK